MNQHTVMAINAVQEHSPIYFHSTKNRAAKKPAYTSHALPWAGWAAYLKAESEITADREPGPAIIPAAFMGDVPSKTAVTEINAAVVQIDGVEIDAIIDRIQSNGWSAAIVSTYAHGRTETLLPRDSLLRWLGQHGTADVGGKEINAASITHYAGELLGWLDTADTVEIVDANRPTADGAAFVIGHDPLASVLVTVHLDPPYRPADAKTHAGGCRLWGDVLETIEHAVSGRSVLMKTARNPAAMIPVPRVRPNGEPVYFEMDGIPLDWRLLGVEEPAAATALTAMAATSRGKKKKREGAAAWMDRLNLTDKGAIISNLPNLVLILENDPRAAGVMAYNAFTGETVLRSAPGMQPDALIQLDDTDWTPRDRINGDLWSDAHDDALRNMLEAAEEDGGYYLRVSDRDLKAAIGIAAKGSAFHPVRDYLSGLMWDKKPRVDRLFIDFLGANDDPYHREVAKLMMVGAVARAFEPGCKLDESVILEGLQGVRKTTFIETLAVNWYAELEAGMDDPKGAVEQMQGAWIVEMAELTGLAKAEVRRAKAFLSRHTDKCRLAYARRAREFPRGCIFIGSTNDGAYLKDPTGGRRFLPVACNVVGTIDIERLRTEIDQMWAEAVNLFMAMRQAQPTGRLPLWLSDEAARTTARTLQASRTIDSADDSIVGEIEAWLETEKKTRVCLRELWERCLLRDATTYTNAWAATLGGVMRGLPGWAATGTRESFEGYGQQRAFARQEVSGAS